MWRDLEGGIEILVCMCLYYLLNSPVFEKGTGGIYSISFSPKTRPQIGQPAQSYSSYSEPSFFVPERA